MKTKFIVLLSVFASTVAFGQDEANDTTRVRLGKTRFTITTDNDTTTVKTDTKPKKASAYWSGIGVGINLLTQTDGDMTLPRKYRQWENEPIRSLTWNLNFVDAFIPLSRNKHHVGLVTGAGITYRSFSFVDNNQDMVSTKDTTALIDNIDGRTYTKRKFRVAYLSVPLLIGFNTSTDNKDNFHISTGVIGNLRIGSLYKQKFEEQGQERKVRNRDDFNLNPLSFDYTVRAGYRGLTFFFNYGLTPLFKTGTGPELIPITFGISI